MIMRMMPEPDTSQLPPGAWGMCAALDGYGCDPDWIADEGVVRRFFARLVPAIGMTAHGPLWIDRFGSGDLHGLSAMQAICTSSITWHADEPGCRCFLDVFSCKAFDPLIVMQHMTASFGGLATAQVTYRGIR
jgi:S-adenosylmethionine/arginine decarboxylase-like enzyme